MLLVLIVGKQSCWKCRLQCSFPVSQTKVRKSDKIYLKMVTLVTTCIYSGI